MTDASPESHLRHFILIVAVIFFALGCVGFAFLGLNGARETRGLMALWLPNIEFKTLGTAGRVLHTVCHGDLQQTRLDGRYQEWSIVLKYWPPCSVALQKIAIHSSSGPIDWLYRFAKSVGTPEKNSGVVGDFVIDVPNYQELFTHYMGDDVAHAATVEASSLLALNMPTLHVPAITGEVVSASVNNVRVEPSADRFSFAIKFGNGEGGSIFASANGYIGAFNLFGYTYEITVLANGTQRLQVRKLLDIPDHPPKFNGGILFNQSQADRLSQTAVGDLVAVAKKNPGRIDSSFLRRWSQAPCLGPYKLPPPDTETVVKVLFVHTNAPQVPGIASIDPEDAAPLNWKEVGEAIATGASDAFRRQGFATRVKSLEPVTLDFAEGYWFEKLRDMDVNAWPKREFPYDDPVDLYRDVMLLAGTDKPSEPTEVALAKAIAADPQLSREMSNWRHVIREQRLLAEADILAFVGGGPSNGMKTYCGASGAVRATLGTAVLAVRLDCALLNDSFTHELGHLLGARHEKSYECRIDPRTGKRKPDDLHKSDNECELDDVDYGLCKHRRARADGEECIDEMDSGPARSSEVNLFKNRGYIDSDSRIATVMASGDVSRAAPQAVFGGAYKSTITRRPYWSSIASAELDGVAVSDGECCDDGRVIDAYAASCVGKSVSSVAPPPISVAVDFHELQQTQTFELGVPGRGHVGDLANKPEETEAIRIRLMKRAAQLKLAQIKTIFVEGFGDAIGDDRQNDVISKRRAMTVAEVLCEAYPEAFIGTREYGKRLPEIPEEENTQERRNRRVLISWPSSGVLHSAGAPIRTEACDKFNEEYKVYQTRDKIGLAKERKKGPPKRGRPPSNMTGHARRDQG